MKGLQEALELQVARGENAEARLRRFRAQLEDELHDKHAELKEMLGRGAKVGEAVTRRELDDAASALKQEFRAMLEEVKLAALQSPPAPATPRQERATALRDELDLVEKAIAEEATSRWAARSPEAVVSAPSFQDQEVLLQQRRTLETLSEKAALGDRMIEGLRRDVSHLYENLSTMQAVTRPEVELLAEQVADNLWNLRLQSMPAKEGPASGVEGGRAPSVEDLRFQIQDLAEEFASLSAETATKVAELVGDVATNRQNNEMMVVMLETTGMRLDALEERQRCLRAEVAGADIDHRLERTWQAVEEEGSRHATSARQIDGLQRRVQALERGSSVGVSPSRCGRSFMSDGPYSGPPSPFVNDPVRLADGIISEIHGGPRHSGLPLGTEAVLKEALGDVRHEVASLRRAVAELANFTGIEISSLASSRILPSVPPSEHPGDTDKEAGLELRRIVASSSEEAAELREGLNRLGARVSGCELDLSQLRRELNVQSPQRRVMLSEDSPRVGEPRLSVPGSRENVNSFVRRTLAETRPEDLEEGSAQAAASANDAGLQAWWLAQEPPSQLLESPGLPQRLPSVPTIRQVDWSGEFGATREMTPAPDLPSNIVACSPPTDHKSIQ